MKRSRNLKKLIMTFAAVAGVTIASGTALSGAYTAFASDTQEKLDSAKSSIDKLRKEQSGISSEISDLNEQAEEAGVRINNLNDDITGKQDDIENVNAEIADIESDMDVRYDDMKLRIQYIYESGDMGLMQSLFTTDEFSEFLNRAEYIQKIYDYDRNELATMAGLYQDREDKKDELETDLADLESLKSDAEAEARSLETLLMEKKDELKLSDEKLKELENLALKYEKQLEEERIAREEEERRKKEEAEKKAREEQAAKEKAAKEAAEREAAAKKAAEEKSAKEAAARQTTAAPATAAPTTQAPTTAAPTTAAQPAASPAPTQTTTTSQSSNINSNDLAMLAAIIECEAGNQPYEGRLAVGSVVMNRVASNQFPNSISGVIYQSGQFTPVASGRFATVLARGAASTNVQAARDVLGGVRNVPYLFFHVYSGYVNPRYGSYSIIQDHIFYNY